MDERERTARLATEYERHLARDRRDERRARGAFYTPPELVDRVLDRALIPGSRVRDPASGTGHFLVAAARRLGDVRAVHGSDLDPEAVAIARLRLQAEDPSVPATEIAERVRVADGLTAWAGECFDAVVGNPPFLGQLRRRTASREAGRPGAYTDTSALFLQRSLGLVRDGGVVALVQPLSVLSAREAAPVREAVAAVGAVEDLWVGDRPAFHGTRVHTCVPVVRVGAPSVHGADWGLLAAPAFGIPRVELPVHTGTLGDLATCTADFRDQYYGLVPHVRDTAGRTLTTDEAPLVTSGLIDPAECRWGSASTRFARQGYAAPAVDVAGLGAADERLGRWAAARLAPKVLVAGQGRVIEAAADVEGRWLPSVPVVSVVPHDPADVARALAVLLAPPVAAHAAARYLGAGLAPGSVKVSARQAAALPLPVDATAWAEAAVLATDAQVAEPHARPALLDRLAAVMTVAYGLAANHPARSWWTGRVHGSAGRGGEGPEQG